MARLGRLAAPALLAVALQVAAGSPAAARTAAIQEAAPDTTPRDTLTADSAAADTLPAPDTAAVPAEVTDPLLSDTLAAGAREGDTVPTREAVAAADTAPADTVGAGREPYFPDAFPTSDSGYSAVVWRCDRECLLDRSAHTLLDLLEDEVPGIVPFRGTFFGGPHHFTDGLLGPALTTVRVEELPLPELSAGQVDLSRIPLAWLSEVQVIRRAGELQLRLIPIRHRTPQAYSRVTAATGEPNLNLVRGLFTNGLGRHLSVSTGIDLLNTGGRLAGSDHLDFWAMASWTPADGSGGVELLWRTQNVTRLSTGEGGGEGTPDDGGEEQTDPLREPDQLRRRDAYLQARGEIASGVRIHVAAGRSEWSERTPGAGRRGGFQQPEEEEDGEQQQGPLVEAEGATLSVQADRPWGFGRASFQTWTGDARPRVRGELEAGIEPIAGVRVDGGVRAGQWREFSTRSYRAGLRWEPDLGVDLDVRASGARGTRGLPRPWTGRADSLSFEEYRGDLSLELGAYRFSGSASLQTLGRHVPFATTFDRGLNPGLTDPELLALQGRVVGPILPLGALLGGADVSPFELDLTVRQNRNRTPRAVLYAPQYVTHAEIRFRDQFFQDDLGVNFELGTRHRTEMNTVERATGEVSRVPSRTTTGLSLVLRIVGAHIWYRSENLGRVLAGNLAGQEYPPFRSSFGIKWEFTN